MTSRPSITAALATFVAGAAFAFLPLPSPAQSPTPMAPGEYVFHLAGCEGCHTDKKNNGDRLAGGRAFKTDYGTFYSPNITPDPDTGIGTWDLSDFRTAMREGIAPDGSHYFPAFPYTSYTHMTDQDVADLWDYLQAQPAVARTNQDHDLQAPFSWRWLMAFWNLLYLDEGPKPEWPRGQYVAEALSHCHECHTPRNALGGYQSDRAYAGTKRNPEGISIPNITPDRDTGTGKWGTADFDMLFTIGMLPDGDFVGGVMGESVSHTTSKMTASDRKAMIDYLQSLTPIKNQIESKKPKDSATEEW